MRGLMRFIGLGRLLTVGAIAFAVTLAAALAAFLSGRASASRGSRPACTRSARYADRSPRSHWRPPTSGMTSAVSDGASTGPDDRGKSERIRHDRHSRRRFPRGSAEVAPVRGQG